MPGTPASDSYTSKFMTNLAERSRQEAISSTLLFQEQSQTIIPMSQTELILDESQVTIVGYGTRNHFELKNQSSNSNNNELIEDLTNRDNSREIKDSPLEGKSSTLRSILTLGRQKVQKNFQLSKDPLLCA
jgi:hypothetical protein